MKIIRPTLKRIIALDMHPDVFCAAALEGSDPATAKTVWIIDRLPTLQIRKWAKKKLLTTDTVVLEASGNSFEIVAILKQLGIRTIVLESQQAGKIRNNDRCLKFHSINASMYGFNLPIDTVLGS